MGEKRILLKDGIVFLCTWVTNKLGLLLPAILLLMILMVIDYISGMLAAKKEALEDLANCEYGWSSKKSLLGIYKKIGYMLTVLVAVCIDYMIFKFSNELGLEYTPNTFFGLIVAIWFVINEILSILENIGRMGTELPDFLKNVLVELRKKLNDKDK